jgi:hypothetical protein
MRRPVCGELGSAATPSTIGRLTFISAGKLAWYPASLGFFWSSNSPIRMPVKPAGSGTASGAMIRAIGRCTDGSLRKSWSGVDFLGNSYDAPFRVRSISYGVNAFYAAEGEGHVRPVADGRRFGSGGRVHRLRAPDRACLGRVVSRSDLPRSGVDTVAPRDIAAATWPTLPQEQQVVPQASDTLVEIGIILALHLAFALAVLVTLDAFGVRWSLIFGSNDMLDVILIAAGCGCFALAIAYTYACDRL